MAATSLKDKREQIRRQLAKNGHNADVDRIVRASKKRVPLTGDILFQFLASAAVPDPPTHRKAIIRKHKQWESFSRQLETVAKHGERLVSDSSSHIEGHIPSLQDSFQAPVPPRLFRGMRVYAGYARLQARWLGTFLRKISQAERWNAVNLLFYVRAATGKLFENELARLLTETCEIADTQEKFTADKLRKLWERHVLPIAKSHEQIDRNRRSLAAEMLTFRQTLLTILDKSTP
jgi:hypothetical protein